MGIFLPFNETELESLPDRLSFPVDRDLEMGRKSHPCSSHRWRPVLASSKRSVSSIAFTIYLLGTVAVPVLSMVPLKH